MNYGRVEQRLIESEALEGNRLGDPHVRPLPVYLPPGYDDDPERRYITLYLLSSHGNTGQAFLNWKPWEETLPQKLDRWINDGSVNPVIVVMPDCWTKLGSSQFLDSVMGEYESYLVGEIVPLIDQTYRTLPDRAHRGIVGFSSGGYGALMQGMRNPEVFGGVACHAGDMYWEYTCLPNIAELHSALQKYGGAAEFLANIETLDKKSGTFWKTAMTLCWAMVHGTNPAAPLGFDLPIDEVTGALLPQIWERWLGFDPIRLIDNEAYADALESLKILFFDAGLYDEYQLQVGARVLHQKLAALNIPHIHEEFPGRHSSSDVRYDRSLGLLSKALA